MIIPDIKLPKGWNVQSLEFLGTFKNGINKDKDSFGAGAPLVNLEDVFGKVSLKRSVFSLVAVTENEKKNYNLKKGDVLFVRSSLKPKGVGLTIVVEEDLDDTVFSGFLIRFRSNNKLDNEFKKHCFFGEDFRKRLIRYSTISANTNINQDALKNLWLIVPPRDTQRETAKLLSLWDTAIGITERLIESKIVRHAAVSIKLLSRKTNTVSLKTFLKPTLRAVSKPANSYWALGIRSHCKGTFRRFVENPNSVAMDTLYRVKHDDLIVNITFAWEGAIAFVEQTDEDCFVSHRFPTFEVNINKALPDYLRHVIIQKRFIRNLGTISPGGAGRNRVLNKTDFLNLKISLPNVSEQEKIGDVLNMSLKEISLLKTKLELLKKQKRGLMQKLLTGQWRVKVDNNVE